MPRPCISDRLHLAADEEEHVEKGLITDLFRGARIRWITFAMWCAW